MGHFLDPATVEGYAEATSRRVPALNDLRRMATQLLSERIGDDACILVLGAGGGLELKAFARACPCWSFVGVDPSQPMLDLAASMVGEDAGRVEFVRGYADDAPNRSFDGATCLLTLHFLTRSERLDVLLALRARLRPGAALIIAHHCRPDVGRAEDWLARSVTFASGREQDPKAAARSAEVMAANLTLLPAEEEETLLREAGFHTPAMFYAALSFRGWVAYA